MIKAVLFDLEDTLVVRDSYQWLVDQAIYEMISCIECCHVQSAEQLFTRVRPYFATTSATIEALGISKREFHACLDRVVLAEKVETTRGVPQILGNLAAKGLKLGIITNMPRRLALTVLEAASIEPSYFSTIVTACQVAKPKPAHDPFRMAMSQLEVPAHQCLMIGDRETVDLDPAKRLGIATALFGGAALRADYTLGSLAELEQVVEQHQCLRQLSLDVPQTS